MDAKEIEIFKQRGKQMIDYAGRYLGSLRTCNVAPDVENGYLTRLLPDSAPEEPDEWEDVMNDVDKAIIPGLVHFQSPHFHAYFPFVTSHPSICANILTDAINCIPAGWHASPAATELEVITLDWLAKLLKLPKEFLHGSKGGGVIMGSASETTLMCMMAARQRAINEQLKKTIGSLNPPTTHAIWEKLVAYTSDQAHSSVFRAGLFSGVEVRAVASDDDCSMQAHSLEEAIAEDKKNGRIPFMVVATLGTTSSLGFDNLLTIGPICEREGLWLHVDAAYAGSGFICPEFRPLLNGVEYANSFNFNTHKWLMVHFECSTLWVRNSDELTKPFEMTPAYFAHVDNSANKMPNFRHWQIDMSRGFRSLKLWFVLRLFGAKHLREHIRNHVILAKQLEALVRSDDRFEVTYPAVMGLVTFRLKAGNEATNILLTKLEDGKRLFMSPTMVKGKEMLRFVVSSPFTKPDDITFAWKEITSQADTITT